MTKIGISSATDIFKGKPTILSVKFGEQCEFVDANEFEGCTNLETINDDNVITSIGECAFAGTNLKVVNFKKATEIGGSAFEGCKSLSSVNIPTVESIGEGAFKNCTELKTAIIDNTELNTPTPFEMGDSNSTNPKTKTIGANAFAGCINLKNINLDNCGKIGMGAFSGCESLNEIYLNCSIIPKNAFENCTNITQVTLSDGDSNGEEAFIGEEAFSGCEKLSKVYLNNKFKLSNIDAFPHTIDETSEEENIICNITFYVSPEDYPVYTGVANELGWAKYKNYIVKNPNSNQIIYITKNNESIGLNDNIGNKVSDNTYYNNNDNAKYGILTLNEDIKTLNLSSILSDEGKENLSSIEYIPNSCTAIDEYAFAGCVELPNFTIPDSITKIGDGAFAGCTNITKFIRKNPEFVTVSYDGKAVISGTTLICVLPKDDSDTEGRICDISKITNTLIKRIGKSCFHGCKNMRRVDIPSTVSSIGDNAFENCENLCEIHLTNNIPTIGANIFKGVREDFKIFVPEGSLLDYSNDEGWQKYATHIYPKPGNYEIIYYGGKKIDDSHTYISSSAPNGNYFKIKNISSIPANYFANTTFVVKVILADNITTINTRAFKYCKKLEYIYLSDNVERFNDECFYGCINLTRIHIPIKLKTEYTYNQGDKISGASSTITKDGFGDDVFYGCKNLKEFGTYYKGCVSDDNRCYIHGNEIKFFAQGGLSEAEKEYEIPDNITSIYKYAFKGSGITSISIGKNTQSIGAYAFYGCEELQSITNWDNVKYISPYAFKGCVKLGKISLPTYLKTINNNAFENCAEMYINTNIPDTVTTIGSYAFSGCTNFKYTDGELRLKNISHINASAFYGCSSLNEVYINDEITNIDRSAFERCTSLSIINLPSSLTNIESSAFKGCTSLYSINLPSSLTNIGSSAFEGCTSLIAVNLPSSITNIESSAFKGCTKLENVRFGESTKLKVLSDSIFDGCTSLSSINLPSSLTNIGNSAFNGCRNLWGSIQQSISLPDSITNIGHHAFYGCDSITTISLPSSLKKIGTQCFVNTTYFSNPSVAPLANNDYSFNIGMASKILNIYIPYDLTSPPTFTNTNGMDDTTATPFGDPTSKSIYIQIAKKLLKIYSDNAYWKKYKSIFTTI